MLSLPFIFCCKLVFWFIFIFFLIYVFLLVFLYSLVYSFTFSYKKCCDVIKRIFFKPFVFITLYYYIYIFVCCIILSNIVLDYIILFDSIPMVFIYFLIDIRLIGCFIRFSDTLNKLKKKCFEIYSLLFDVRGGKSEMMNL